MENTKPQAINGYRLSYQSVDADAAPGAPDAAGPDSVKTPKKPASRPFFGRTPGVLAGFYRVFAAKPGKTGPKKRRKPQNPVDVRVISLDIHGLFPGGGGDSALFSACHTLLLKS